VSCIFSAGLQAAVYQRLTGDVALGALVGTAVYDSPLEHAPDQIAPDHITLGEETVRAWDTMTSLGATHDFTVTVHSGRDGFDVVKKIAGAVCDSLIDAQLSLDQGQLVGLRFLQAKAVRGRAPVKRNVTLRFRAVVDLDN
jgi:hypothetical protein